MPYEVKKDGDCYTVVNKENGDVKARHEPPDAAEKAHEQVDLLNELEKGAYDGDS